MSYALNYQLRERTVFVKPSDPIVADLLFTYAICEAQTNVLESALKLLEKSREYGFENSALLKATEDRYHAIIATRKTKSAIFWLGIVLGSVGFLYYCYRRKWFFLTPAAHRRYLAEKMKKEQPVEAGGPGLK